MRKMIALTVLALIASLALAQSPRATATDVFDRVVAREVPCNEFDLTRTVAAAYDRAFCGYISDALTDINKSWTAEEFAFDGYAHPLGVWIPNYDIFDDGTVYMAAFNRHDWDALAMLLVGYDSTLIILTFDRY